MHIIRVNRVDLDPAILRHMIQIVDAATHGVTVTRVVNGALPEVDGLLDGQIGSVVRVQNTVGVGRPRTHREVTPVKTRAVVVDVVKLRSRLVPAGDHGTHAKPVSPVTPHSVRQQLRRRGDAYALLIPELVHAALYAQVALPEGAVGGATRHGTEQERVDLDDLLHRPGGNVRAHGGTGVHGDDDPAVEFKREGRGTLGELHLLSLIAVAAGGREIVAAEVRGLKMITIGFCALVRIDKLGESGESLCVEAGAARLLPHTHVGDIGNIELARLAQGQLGYHGATADGPRVIPPVKFGRADVQDIAPN